MAVAIPVVEEAAPVVIRALLVPFIVLAGYFVAWGVVFCMDALVRAFFGTIDGTVGWIPYLNRVVEKPLHGIEQKLTSFLGGLEAHFDRQMATRWHQLAQLFERWASDAEAAAVMEWNLARAIYRVWTDLRSGRYMRDIATWVKHEVAHLHGVQTVVIHKTTVIEKTIGAKSKAGAITATRPLAAELADVIDVGLPRIRSRERATERELGRLWKWAHRRTVPIASGALLGALAYALGRLGLGWARCSKVQKVGRNLCGMEQGLLESLLADSLLIAGTLSLVEFANEMVGVTETAVRPITTFWRAS